VSGAPPNARLGRRIEYVIRVLAPMLDLMLLVGDRVWRALEHDDPDYVLARMPHEGESAPRGLPRDPTRRSRSGD
jgi:hypothetical protein